jgi:pheromone a factor receptor
MISPSAVALPLFACLAILLCIPPLIAHAAARNLAATVLATAILICNIQNLLNALIWPSYPLESKWDGRGLCDVEIKVYVGAYIAITGAMASVFRQLAIILDPNFVSIRPTNRLRYKDLTFEIGLCILLPICIMAVSYVVQSRRYYLVALSGCVPAFYPSWVSSVLIHMWPVILSAIGAAYCLMAVYRLIKHRNSVSSILSTLSSISKARYTRLFGLAVALLLVYCPFAIYTLAYKIRYTGKKFSWEAVHPPGWSESIVIFTAEQERLREYRPIDRWCHIVTAFVLFILFGLGYEAMFMYKRWLKSCKTGLQKVMSRCRTSQSSFSTKELREGRLNIVTGEPRHFKVMPNKTVRDPIDLELARIDNDNDPGQGAAGQTLRC